MGQKLCDHQKHGLSKKAQFLVYFFGEKLTRMLCHLEAGDNFLSFFSKILANKISFTRPYFLLGFFFLFIGKINMIIESVWSRYSMKTIFNKTIERDLLYILNSFNFIGCLLKYLTSIMLYA